MNRKKNSIRILAAGMEQFEAKQQQATLIRRDASNENSWQKNFRSDTWNCINF